MNSELQKDAEQQPPPAVACSDLLECQQCGHKSNPEISWLGNCGVLWKVVVWCKVCKAAAQGKTREEARKRFADGDYELEAL
jgi:hypothetical protein